MGHDCFKLVMQIFCDFDVGAGIFKKMGVLRYSTYHLKAHSISNNIVPGGKAKTVLVSINLIIKNGF